MKLFIIILVVLLLIYLLLKLSIKIEQKMLFQPTKLHNKYHHKIKQYELLLQEINENIKIYELTIYINKKKDKYINALYYFNPNTPYHIIYAHGNGGNISNCINVPLTFINIASVLVFDYRGYGKSSYNTNICENDLYKDILTVWKYSIHQLNINAHNIILYGHSLGSSVVAWLGSYLSNTVYKPKLIIMQAGFSSLKNIVSDIVSKYITIFLNNSFDSEKYVKIIGDKIKIYVAHSYKDELIKIHHKDTLLNANNYIIFSEIDGTHNYVILDNLYNIIKTELNEKAISYTNIK